MVLSLENVFSVLNHVDAERLALVHLYESYHVHHRYSSWYFTFFFKNGTIDTTRCVEEERLALVLLYESYHVRYSVVGTVRLYYTLKTVHSTLQALGKGGSVTSLRK